MKFELLNKLLENYLESFQINEMAKLNNVIEVNNEDITNEAGDTLEKFAHFHWVYNHDIHFKFSDRIPKNISELKLLIAFKDDLNQISNSELSQVLKEIQKPVMNGRYKNKIVFDAAKELWSTLHPNRDINKELINL